MEVIDMNSIPTTRPYNYNNGIYSCPECHSILGKIHDFYNENADSYVLQCPNNREHCTRKIDVLPGEASFYKDIPIQRCPKCNSVLVYQRGDYYNYELVCPKDYSHCTPVYITEDKLKKLGYHPHN
jgi:hypothetical protein